MLNYVHSWICEAFLFWCRCSTAQGQMSRFLQDKTRKQEATLVSLVPAWLPPAPPDKIDFCLVGDWFCCICCFVLLFPPLKCDVIVTVLLLCVNNSWRPVEVFCFFFWIMRSETGMKHNDLIKDLTAATMLNVAAVVKKVTWSGLALEKQPF